MGQRSWSLALCRRTHTSSVSPRETHTSTASPREESSAVRRLLWLVCVKRPLNAMPVKVGPYRPRRHPRATRTHCRLPRFDFASPVLSCRRQLSSIGVRWRTLGTSLRARRLGGAGLRGPMQQRGAEHLRDVACRLARHGRLHTGRRRPSGSYWPHFFPGPAAQHRLPLTEGSLLT